MAARAGHVGSESCPDSVHRVSFGLAHPFVFPERFRDDPKDKSCRVGKLSHIAVPVSPRGLGTWGCWSSRGLPLPGWLWRGDTS